MILLHTQRVRLLETARAMNRMGLNQGSSGNVSVRCGSDFLITPSALAYEDCGTGDVVRLDLEGQVVQGSRKPSSEWRLHRDIYRERSEIGAVLHAHSTWCTTLACLEMEIPPLHYMVAVAGGDWISCAPYALFGTAELSEHMMDALSEGRRACLLAHHGLVCCAGNLTEVLALAVEVEELARVYVQALQAGQPAPLSAEEMQAVQERFSSYRQP